MILTHVDNIVRNRAPTHALNVGELRFIDSAIRDAMTYDMRISELALQRLLESEDYIIGFLDTAMPEAAARTTFAHLYTYLHHKTPGGRTTRMTMLSAMHECNQRRISDSPGWRNTAYAMRAHVKGNPDLSYFPEIAKAIATISQITMADLKEDWRVCSGRAGLPRVNCYTEDVGANLDAVARMRGFASWAALYAVAKENEAAK